MHSALRQNGTLEAEIRQIGPFDSILRPYTVQEQAMCQLRFIEPVFA